MRSAILLALFAFAGNAASTSEILISPPSGLCAGEIDKVWLDVVFLVDSSHGMTEMGLRKAEAFLRSTLRQLTIGEGFQKSRVGIITYAAEAHVVRDLTSSDNSHASLRYAGDEEANLFKAISTAIDMFDRSQPVGHRKRAIVIAASAFEEEGPHDAAQIAAQFRIDGGSIVTIDYHAAEKSLSPLANLASNGLSFTNDDHEVANLFHSLLHVNCFCPVDRHGASSTSFGSPDEGCIGEENIQADWVDAADLCRDEGGMLVKVDSVAKQRELDQLTSFSYWIGLRFDTTLGRFYWQDESAANFARWAPAQPDLSIGECAFSSGSRWYSAACEGEKEGVAYHNYYCEQAPCSADYDCYKKTVAPTVPTGPTHRPFEHVTVPTGPTKRPYEHVTPPTGPTHRPNEHVTVPTGPTHRPYEHVTPATGPTHRPNEHVTVPTGPTHRPYEHVTPPTGPTHRPNEHVTVPTGPTHRPYEHVTPPTGPTHRPNEHVTVPTGPTHRPYEHVTPPTGPTHRPNEHVTVPTGPTHRPYEHVTPPTGPTHRPNEHVTVPTGPTHRPYEHVTPPTGPTHRPNEHVTVPTGPTHRPYEHVTPPTGPTHRPNEHVTIPTGPTHRPFEHVTPPTGPTHRPNEHVTVPTGPTHRPYEHVTVPTGPTHRPNEHVTVPTGPTHRPYEHVTPPTGPTKRPFGRDEARFPNGTAVDLAWWQQYATSSRFHISSVVAGDSKGVSAYPLRLSAPITFSAALANAETLFQKAFFRQSVKISRFDDLTKEWIAVPTVGLMDNMAACVNGVLCPVKVRRDEISMTVDLSPYHYWLRSLKNDAPYQFEIMMTDVVSNQFFSFVVQARARTVQFKTPKDLKEVAECIKEFLPGRTKTSREEEKQYREKLPQLREPPINFTAIAEQRMQCKKNKDEDYHKCAYYMPILQDFMNSRSKGLLEEVSEDTRITTEEQANEAKKKLLDHELVTETKLLTSMNECYNKFLSSEGGIKLNNPKYLECLGKYYLHVQLSLYERVKKTNNLNRE